MFNCNLQFTCPEFFIYVLNTYRQPSELFVANSDEIILSQEGTTQGDTSAMGMYACSLMPLVEDLRTSIDTADKNLKQIFYADDGAAAGKLQNIKQWWDKVQKSGPLYGYYPKSSKSWLIVKPAFMDEAKRLFPDINITSKGHLYLGSFIGTEEGLENTDRGLDGRHHWAV